MLHQIKTALRNYIKQSFLSLIFDDSQLYPQGQYTNNGISGKFTRMSVYGVCSSPPKGAHILLINAQGQESVKFGFVNDFINRKKNLKEGEVALFNSVSGTFIFLKEDGSIEINGDITLTGDIIANGISLKNHTHAQGADSDSNTQVETEKPS